MQQSSVIAAFLLIGYVFYITGKGDLPVLLNILGLYQH